MSECDHLDAITLHDDGGFRCSRCQQTVIDPNDPEEVAFDEALRSLDGMHVSGDRFSADQRTAEQEAREHGAAKRRERDAAQGDVRAILGDALSRQVAFLRGLNDFEMRDHIAAHPEWTQSVLAQLLRQLDGSADDR